MVKKINQLPVVLTSFAYRSEYFYELDKMVATVREHHPDWQIVLGRGPSAALDLPTLEVHSPSGKSHLPLPALLNLNGTVDDWRKITKIKAWWIDHVWHKFGHLAGKHFRLLWIDADARVNGPLEIEVDTEAEVIAGTWCSDMRHPGYTTITSGFLYLQGSPGGKIESILDQWSAVCISHAESLLDPPIDSDQEVLNQLLKVRPSGNGHYILIKLDSDKYYAIANKEGKPLPGALVEQWGMARTMKWSKDRDLAWPPPEEIRKQRAS